MDFDCDQIEKVLNLLKDCRVPELINDVDTKPIGSSDFEQYRHIANEQLHMLLDVLYQNRNLLCTQAYDNQIIKLRVNLLLVACEQLEPNPFFHSDDKLLLTSLRKIVFDHVKDLEDVVYEKCIKSYKEKLTKGAWKKSIGAVHGFPFFCEIFLVHKPQIVDDDFIMFALSIGANLTDHHDPHFKGIGAKIYLKIIQLCDNKRLKALNIHEVIFSEILPLINRSTEIEFNDHIYECLYHVVKIDKRDDTNWSKFDDVMAKLINQFSTESDAKLCKVLIHKILKFCTINNENVQINFNDLSQSTGEYFEKLRENFQESNFKVARWVKKLMEMMTRESIKMLNHDAIFILNSFHCIYISSIYTIEPKIFQNQIDEFMQKFALVLMQVVRQSKDNETKLAVKEVLKTFQIHQKDNQDLVNCFEEIKGKF